MRLLLPVLVVLIGAPLAIGDSGGSFIGTLPLEHGDWAAIRFNVTPDSDLAFDLRWTGCDEKGPSYTSYKGAGWVQIMDGVPLIRHLSLGFGAWGPGSDTVAASLAGAHATTPGFWVSDLCASSYEGYISATPRNASVSFIVLSGAPVGEFSCQAHWTRGVTSHEVLSGPGTMKTKAQFSQGAFASAWPSSAEVDVGILASHQIAAEHDFVGWFWPQEGSGVSSERCTKNASPCPPRQDEFYPLASKGPTTWNFGLDYQATYGGGPYYALGGAELPDDTFLK